MELDESKRLETLSDGSFIKTIITLPHIILDLTPIEQPPESLVTLSLKMSQSLIHIYIIYVMMVMMVYCPPLLLVRLCSNVV